MDNDNNDNKNGAKKLALSVKKMRKLKTGVDGGAWTSVGSPPPGSGAPSTGNTWTA